MDARVERLHAAAEHLRRTRSRSSTVRHVEADLLERAPPCRRSRRARQPSEASPARSRRGRSCRRRRSARAITHLLDDLGQQPVLDRPDRARERARRRRGCYGHGAPAAITGPVSTPSSTSARVTPRSRDARREHVVDRMRRRETPAAATECDVDDRGPESARGSSGASRCMYPAQTTRSTPCSTGASSAIAASRCLAVGVVRELEDRGRDAGRLSALAARARRRWLRRDRDDRQARRRAAPAGSCPRR